MERGCMHVVIRLSSFDFINLSFHVFSPQRGGISSSSVLLCDDSPLYLSRFLLIWIVL